MNVFVLSTGRCGSTTFIRACRHITNFSAAHESRTALVGAERLRYPPNHIEADNRLSWLLGRLDEVYGDDAIYVHQRRSDEGTAKSVVQRYHYGIIKAYREQVLLGSAVDNDPFEVSLDYCNTVNKNIEAFLKDKTRKMGFSMERAREDFEKFWAFIGAEGDLSAALAEWGTTYNASPNPVDAAKRRETIPARAVNKLGRVLRELPTFIKYT